MRMTNSLRRFAAVLIGFVPVFAAAQSVPPTDPNASLEQRLQRLEQRQQELEKQVQQKEAEIQELKKQQNAAAGGATAPAQAKPGAAPPAAPTTPPATGAPPEVGASSPPVQTAEAAPVAPKTEPEPLDIGEGQAASPLAPGTGLVLAKSDYGMVKLGLYALLRTTDMEPANQTLTTHLGDQIPIVPVRRDIQLHRILMPFSGWLYDPKFTYTITIWTVNDTEQVRVIGAFQYKFTDWLTVGGGVGAMPGTRSLNYSHPFWFGHDRVMADEFFRSGFTSGIWAGGKVHDDLEYRFMVGNNISTLGVPASKNTRALAYGGTLAWMPTTGEFGPSGAYDDFEWHQDLATRFGVSVVSSPGEDRASQPSNSQPDATQIRIADSQLAFATGSLAPGVTIQRLDYETRAADASFKYHGFSLVSEIYYRELTHFTPTTLSLPIPSYLDTVRDKGYMIQGGFFPLPHTLELYASTSHIYPQGSLGFHQSYEGIVGMNWFWTHTRLQRLNVQIIDVYRSAASSTFGYYIGGINGPIFNVDVSMMF